MNKSYIVVVLIVIIVVAAVIIDRIIKKPSIFPYQKKKLFLSETEKVFFEVLLQIVNNQYFIFPQVHMASILEVKKGQSNYMGYFNKIIGKSFDFVLFDKQSLSPLLVIELDDYSHEQPKRIKRDNFVNETLNATDLKILHVKPSNRYDIQELSKLILNSIRNPNIPTLPL